MKITVLMTLLGAACHPLRGCAESEFSLAPESRLPRWFSLPPGVSRSDVDVVMTYYIGASGHTARFVMRHRDGRELAEVEGAIRDNHPQTLVPDPGTGPLPYPNYAIVTSNGITEVVEHRRREDSVFYITDDAELKRKLGMPQ
jgi:hypothetical protein